MPDPLHILIDVQDRDLAADQLRHRRAALPDRAALAERHATLAEIDADLVELGERLAELQRSQKRLEDEVGTLEAKAEAENKRLYSGTVTSPRELQALQEEIDGLVRRQRGLEDDLLELMERAEPLLEEVERLESRRDEASADAGRIAERLAADEAAIDAELAAAEAARDAVAGTLEPGLLAAYETLRQRLGGVAVARLEGTQCTGCHLSLPATELDAVRRAGPDTVVHHEECGRILVRA